MNRRDGMSEDKVILELDDRWHKWPEEDPGMKCRLIWRHIAPDDIQVAFYANQKWWEVSRMAVEILGVDAWRELPPPPEGI